MRKQLTVGTALAAATMLVAGGALAADKKMMKPSISVNGYYEGVVGGVLDNTMETKWSYTGMDAGSDGEPDGTLTEASEAILAGLDTKRDDKSDTSALDTKTDAEIHFNGRATLDTGMKIHMRVELEGQHNHSVSDPIDEYFLSVSGSFGQIILGGTGGAPVKMLTGLSGSWATGAGETLSFDVNDWLNPASPGHHYNLQHSRLDTGDGEKVTYISPKLGGFQVGLTYNPGAGHNAPGDTNARINADTGTHDGIEGAVSYTGKFGDVGFGVGAGMTSYQGCNGPSATCDDTGTSDWLVAARIDFGAIRIAAAHKQVTNEDEDNESSLTDAGVRFVSGANSFSLTGVMGEMKNTEASYKAVMGSYARALGPGVKWHANLIWMDSTSDKGAVTGGQYAVNDGMKPDTVTDDTSDNFGKPAEDYLQQMGQKENSGMALVTGIKVVF